MSAICAGRHSAICESKASPTGRLPTPRMLGHPVAGIEHQRLFFCIRSIGAYLFRAALSAFQPGNNPAHRVHIATEDWQAVLPCQAGTSAARLALDSKDAGTHCNAVEIEGRHTCIVARVAGPAKPLGLVPGLGFRP